MEVTVHRAGMLTTLQDLGRRGLLCEGVSIGGAMDPFALRMANLLVGNPEDACVLEVTLLGPDLEFSEEAWISACGARFENVPAWRPFHLEAGGRLRFGPRMEGCRCYVAISGGFEAASALGGRGTHLGLSVGGFEGRALRDGDVLKTAPATCRPAGQWRIDERVLPNYSRKAQVRVVAGAQSAEFNDELFSGTFTVQARSDRMGIRLEGPTLRRTSGEELISTAVAPGTIQVPSDGNPIVLMADAQTLGGYPRVGHIASVDMPLMAQLAPGDQVMFLPVALSEAHEFIQSQNHELSLLRQGLAGKMKPV
jgi:antagonist of KipI